MNKVQMIITLAQPVRDEINNGMFSTFQGTQQELKDNIKSDNLLCLGRIEDSHIFYEKDRGYVWITNITDEDVDYIMDNIMDIPITFSGDLLRMFEDIKKYGNCMACKFINALEGGDI